MSSKQHGKLHLKRTPAEQAEHDLRKARRAARKAAKRARRYHQDSSDGEQAGTTSAKGKKPHNDFDDFEDSYGASSSRSNAHKPDVDYIYAQMEEERFREKMWGAFEDDERLDSLESGFNNYAHIPRRWRAGGMDRMDDELDINPQMMEEEDYAEWIRANMWRCVHTARIITCRTNSMLGRNTLRNLRSRNARRLNEQLERRMPKLSGSRLDG